MRWKSFLICLAVLIWRAWDRLQNPGIWAEDGRVFLKDALTLGWPALLHPYEGYFHTVNRVVMQLLTYFPLVWLPGLITIFCVVLYASTVSIFADRHYRTLVRSDALRVGICSVLCLLPGLPEMLGSLCNSHRILAIYVFFLGLRNYKESYKWYQVAIVFLIAGSAGEILMFVPLFLYRAYLRNQKKLSNFAEVLIVGEIVLWTFLNFAARTTNSEPLVFDLFNTLKTTVAAFTFAFGTQPLLGWRLTENLFRFALPVFWIFAAISTFVLIRERWQTKKTDQIFLTLGLVCICAIQELSWLVRPSDLAMFKSFLPGMHWGQYRLGYFLLFAGFLYWSVFFAGKSPKWGWAYLILYVAVANKFAIHSYGNSDYWPEKAAQLESSMKSGCPKQVVVPLFPDAWQMTFISPNAGANSDCKE